MHQFGESSDLILGDGTPGAGNIRGPLQCTLGQIPLLLQIANAFAKRIVHFGKAILDQLVETPQALVGVVRLFCQIGDAGVDGAGALGLSGHQVFEQGGQAFRPEQMAVDSIDDEVVEKGHGNGVARAGGLALLSPAGAGIVGVDAPVLRCAGPLGHPSAAMGTDGQARQEDGTGIGAHRVHAGIMGLELFLGGIEDGIVKNARNGNFDHALFGMFLPGLAVANAILPPPDIGRVGEDKVQRSDTKTAAFARLISLSIEPGDNLLDAHRRGSGAALGEIP